MSHSSFDTHDLKEFSEKRLQELKTSLEKEHGREFTMEEVRDAGWKIQGFAQILYEITSENMRRQELLRENPKGYAFDRDGYSCELCDGSTSKGKGWYDKYGLKCLTCQKEKRTPGFESPFFVLKERLITSQ